MTSSLSVRAWHLAGKFIGNNLWKKLQKQLNGRFSPYLLIGAGHGDIRRLSYLLLNKSSHLPTKNQDFCCSCRDSSFASLNDSGPLESLYLDTSPEVCDLTSGPPGVPLREGSCVWNFVNKSGLYWTAVNQGNGLETVAGVGGEWTPPFLLGLIWNIKLNEFV